MIDKAEINKVKASVNLTDLVEERLGPAAKLYTDKHIWPCPFPSHDDSNPSFYVYLDTGTFYCFGCGKGGDVYAWTQEIEEISFHEAHNRLKKIAKGAHRPPQYHRTPVAKSTVKQAPDNKWQTAAQAFVERCQHELWGEYGAEALAVLRNRGLTDETIRTARLGCVTQGFALRPDEWGLSLNLTMPQKFIGPGIIIPWYLDGQIWLLNRRQELTSAQVEQGVPKYVILPGSTKALYSIRPLDGTLPVVLVEGEIDALTLHQEAGDLVTAVATGSATGARNSQWKDRLKAMPSVLLCFDADEAGDKARKHWLYELPNTWVWRPLFDDVNAMHQAGFSIRSWIITGLKQS
jgi:DNA primase